MMNIGNGIWKETAWAWGLSWNDIIDNIIKKNILFAIKYWFGLWYIAIHYLIELPEILYKFWFLPELQKLISVDIEY